MRENLSSRKTPFQFKIQTKLLFALLVLSVSVLIISAYAVFDNLAVMGRLALKKQEQLREYAVAQSMTTLETLSEDHLTSLARDQAKIANEFFIKVEVEVQRLSWLASYFWQHPEVANPKIASYSAQEPPPDPSSATLYAFSSQITPEQAQHQIDQLRNLAPTLIAIHKSCSEFVAYITTEEGIMLSAPWYPEDPEDGDGYDPIVRLWYQNAVRARKLSWTPPYVDKFNGKFMMTCSAPFFSADNQIAGVVAIDLLLSDIIKHVMSTQIGNEGYAFLVDSVGKLIVSSGGVFKLKVTQSTAASNSTHDERDTRINLTEIGSPDQRAVIQAMVRGEEGFQRIQTGLRIKNYQEFIAYAPVSATGWSLGVVKPVETVLALARTLEAEIIRTSNATEQEVNEQRLKISSLMLALFSIALGVTVLTAFALAKRITRPILALHKGVATVGQGNLDYQIVVSSGDELEDLAHEFNKMTGDLKGYIKNLEITTVAKKKIETELEIARLIQASLLPQTLPQLPDWEIVACFWPARQVAGDFYDMFPIEGGQKFFFVVADVCDKGVGPAMFGAVIRTLLRAFSDNYSTSSAQESNNLPLILTNDFTIANGTESDMFATAFAGVFDPAAHSVSYINCGHNPPYVLGADHKIRTALKATGPILGVFPGVAYKTQHVTLEPGETLFVFTDGVPEAHNLTGELLNDHRLRAILEQPSTSAAEILQRVKQGVQEHIGTAEQFDDITILVIRRQPEPQS